MSFDTISEGDIKSIIILTISGGHLKQSHNNGNKKDKYSFTPLKI